LTFVRKDKVIDDAFNRVKLLDEENSNNLGKVQFEEDQDLDKVKNIQNEKDTGFKLKKFANVPLNAINDKNEDI